jgi:peptidoglycan/LPS O-acetylase OafA/YrhL
MSAATALPPSTYRPHLDGVRAIAVYLVVAFHAGSGRLNGGFIGVDVFFVLSGYLVTQLLLRDLDRRESIEFSRFYARRFRRLLPAAAVALVATALIYPTFATPIQALDAAPAMRAASLYVSNWYFIGESTDYFAADVAGSPVLHFWSLSVEEQFYLAWPLLFAGFVAVSRAFGARRRQALFLLIAAAMSASLTAALWIARTNTNRAYYGTDTPAYQLLAGALLALAPAALGRFWPSGDRAGRRWPVPLSVAAMVALLFSATNYVAVGAITRGVVATVLTVALIVSLEHAGGPVRAVLSGTTMGYLGRISYGVYLWHWILILLLGATLELGSARTAALTALLATGLASLSYQVLEMPVRRSTVLELHRWPVIVTGLAVSVLLGTLVAPRLLEPTRASGTGTTATAAPLQGAAPVPAGLDWRSAAADHGEFPQCRAADPQACVRVTGTGPHVLLIGDSNGRMYLPPLDDLAEARSFTFSAAVAPGCIWAEGIVRTEEVYDRSCRERQKEWYDTIVPALDPDVVLLVHRAIDDPASPTPIVDTQVGPLPLGTPTSIATFEERAEATTSELGADGRKVVILEPVPVSGPKEDQVQCLSSATYLDECRFVSHLTPTPIEQVYRRIADRDSGVVTVDLDRLVCPYLPICDPVVGGLIVRWDIAHITTRFARTLAPSIGSLLDEQGVFVP